jgi:predicted ATPase
MLRRLRVKGYKSLRDLEVHLKELCVLFGPNAAGKSNLLDLLQLLSQAVSSRNLKEAFEPPYRGKPLESFAFGPEGIKGLLLRDSISFEVEVDVELSNNTIDSVDRQIRELKKGSNAPEKAEPSSSQQPQSFIKERFLRYRIEIEILPRSGILRVADEYLTALKEDGKPTNRRKPFLERVKNKLYLRMEGRAHPTYHERLLDHSLLSLPLYPPHYPHVVALRQEISSWHFFYFEPRERMRAANPVKEVRHIGLMGEELAAFLNTLRATDEGQFRALERALHLIIPSIHGIATDVSDVGEVELKVLEGMTPMPARVISEGTLRALGLLSLFAAKQPPTLVGFEEPENGIHPRRIEAIAEMLKTQVENGSTQVIVTTHSPTLVDLIPDRYLFACRKLDGSTTISEFSPSFGPLSRPSDIEKTLHDESSLSASERLMRGDFDA